MKYWKQEKINNVVHKQSQCDPRKSPNNYFSYVDVSSVSNQTFKISKFSKILGKDAPSRARKVINTGDVIFATVRPSLQRIALVPDVLDYQIASTGFCVLKPIKHKILPEYLYYYLLTKAVKDYVFSREKGATYPAINDSDLFNLTIYLPELDEQRSIAHTLSSVQKAIESCNSQLDFTQELKDSLMEHLFTHGTRSEQRKQTEIGEAPNNWKESILEEVADIIYGVQASVANNTNSEIGIPILTNINISNNGQLNLEKLRYFNLPPKKMEKLLLKKGDVLFNWRSGSKNHIGKTAIFTLDDDYTFASFILRFRVNHQMTNYFLYFYLQYIKALGFFTTNRSQSSINSVMNASICTKIPIIIPPIAEQKKISSILLKITEKIELIQTEIKLYEELFNTLLDKLMSGEISTLPIIKKGLI